MITFYSDLLLAALLQHQVIIKELGNPKKKDLRSSDGSHDIRKKYLTRSILQSYNPNGHQMDSSFYLTRSKTVFGNCHDCRNHSVEVQDEVGIDNIDACGHAGTNFNL